MTLTSRQITFLNSVKGGPKMTNILNSINQNNRTSTVSWLNNFYQFWQQRHWLYKNVRLTQMTRQSLIQYLLSYTTSTINRNLTNFKISSTLRRSVEMVFPPTISVKYAPECIIYPKVFVIMKHV